MTTATKTKKKDILTVSTDNYAWFTCEHGSYRVVETRFGLYKSIDKQGNDLITGLTEQAIHDCTPLHLLAQQPDYDGKYDTVIGSASVTPDL
jgi:hypothetical protein